MYLLSNFNFFSLCPVCSYHLLVINSYYLLCIFSCCVHVSCLVMRMELISEGRKGHMMRILRTALSPLTSPGDRPTSPLSHVTPSYHHSHSLDLCSRSRSWREVLGSLPSNTWNNKVRPHVKHTLCTIVYFTL